jgi:peptidoglycan/LPS O-acetylase OafA/YrhL
MIVNQPTDSTPLDRHIDVLLALRGLACLMVVVAHCDPPRHSMVYHSEGLSYDFSWLLFSAGGVAVRIFFCLSGYLMGKAFYTQRYWFDRRGVIQFFRNRILRIFPLYYFTVFFLSLFVYSEILKLENWIYLGRLVTFTYNHMLPVAFNGALWTLSTEVQFYGLVPFLFWACQRYLKTRRQVAIAAFLLIALSWMLRYFTYLQIEANLNYPQDAIAFVKLVYVPIWMNLDVFLSGFLLNSWFHAAPDRSREKRKGDRRQFLHAVSTALRRKSKVLSILGLIGLYGFTAQYKYYNQEELGLISPTVTLAATSFFIWAFESKSEPQSRSPANRSLKWRSIRNNPWLLLEASGVLSYGIYVWHFPIIAKIRPLLAAEVPLFAYLQRLAIALVLSTLAAWITYYLIEVPAARMKHLKRHQ